MYEPNLPALFHKIAAACGSSYFAPQQIGDFFNCWRIGEYRPAVGQVQPVIAFFTDDNKEIERAINFLGSKFRYGFLLILPIIDGLSQQLHDTAQQKQAKVCSLDQFVVFRNGKLEARPVSKDKKQRKAGIKLKSRQLTANQMKDWIIKYTQKQGSKLLARDPLRQKAEVALLEKMPINKIYREAYDNVRLQAKKHGFIEPERGRRPIKN